MDMHIRLPTLPQLPRASRSGNLNHIIILMLLLVLKRNMSKSVLNPLTFSYFKLHFDNAFRGQVECKLETVDILYAYKMKTSYDQK